MTPGGRHKAAEYATPKQLLRFAVSGGIATVAYSVVAGVFAIGLIWPMWLAHSVAYAVCVPLSYRLQKSFTFQVEEAPQFTRSRFLFQSVLTYFLSTAIAYAADVWNLSRALTILLVCGALPGISYLALRLWVFRGHRDVQSAD
jgi:putative flippase GtrA